MKEVIYIGVSECSDYRSFTCELMERILIIGQVYKVKEEFLEDYVLDYPYDYIFPKNAFITNSYFGKKYNLI